MLKIKMPTNQTYPFNSVNIGDLFEYNCNYYMKIETATVYYSGANCSIRVNAVNLKNGQLTRFSLEKVYLLDAEATITRKFRCGNDHNKKGSK